MEGTKRHFVLNTVRKNNKITEWVIRGPTIIEATPLPCFTVSHDFVDIRMYRDYQHPAASYSLHLVTQRVTLVNFTHRPWLTLPSAFSTCDHSFPSTVSHISPQDQGAVSPSGHRLCVAFIPWCHRQQSVRIGASIYKGSMGNIVFTIFWEWSEWKCSFVHRRLVHWRDNCHLGKVLVGGVANYPGLVILVHCLLFMDGRMLKS